MHPILLLLLLSLTSAFATTPETAEALHPLRLDDSVQLLADRETLITAQRVRVDATRQGEILDSLTLSITLDRETLDALRTTLFGQGIDPLVVLGLRADLPVTVTALASADLLAHFQGTLGPFEDLEALTYATSSTGYPALFDLQAFTLSQVSQAEETTWKTVTGDAP